MIPERSHRASLLARALVRARADSRPAVSLGQVLRNAALLLFFAAFIGLLVAYVRDRRAPSALAIETRSSDAAESSSLHAVLFEEPEVDREVARFLLRALSALAEESPWVEMPEAPWEARLDGDVLRVTRAPIGAPR